MNTMKLKETPMSTQENNKISVNLFREFDRDYKRLEQLFSPQSPSEPDFQGTLILSGEIHSEEQYLQFAKLIFEKGKSIDCLEINITRPLQKSFWEKFSKMMQNSDYNIEVKIHENIELPEFMKIRLLTHNKKVLRQRSWAEASELTVNVQAAIIPETSNAIEYLAKVSPEPERNPVRSEPPVSQENTEGAGPHPTEQNKIIPKASKIYIKSAVQQEAAPAEKNIDKEILSVLNDILKNDEYWDKKTLISNNKPTTVKAMEKLLDSKVELSQIKNVAKKAIGKGIGGKIKAALHNRHDDTHQLYEVVANKSGKDLLSALKEYKVKQEQDISNKSSLNGL